MTRLEYPILYPSFDSILQKIKEKDDVLVSKSIRGRKVYLLHKNHKPNNLLCYIKYESNRGYLTIGREVEELQGKIGKTINRDIFLGLNEYATNPLLVFADPYEIRVMDHDYFYINSYEFQQKANNEIVLAIDRQKLTLWDDYMNPKFRKPEDKNQKHLGEF